MNEFNEYITLQEFIDTLNKVIENNPWLSNEKVQSLGVISNNYGVSHLIEVGNDYHNFHKIIIPKYKGDIK